MGPGNFGAELQDSVCTTFMLLSSPGHPTTLHQLPCPCGHLPPRLPAFTQQPLSPKMWAWEVEKGWMDATPGSSGLSKGVGSTWATCPMVGLVQTSGAVACRAPEVGVGDARRAPRARAERRRHTITNGVDCGLLKQVKELEQEQEVLLQGLEMMARGRDWYQQQLQRVQERQRRLGQSRAGTDFGTAGSPRPLGRLLPKVQEVARCLGELLAAACAGTAPSPAPTSPSAPSWQQQTILMLKEQNRLLTQEVTDKSDRITQLEQEKSALIKQLFEARALSQQEAGPLDSTFI
ncbi:hypothetical protein H920_17106 [Fukomys damarensis]|uniref:Suppressor APC domain-containing protein 2 n=1 Tax=Fukomys damarensis TaxID=885580 RepID=A0A091CUU9_FUKDA|nr:hypothetical protein H920_17106 [Fukomys damarensis]